MSENESKGGKATNALDVSLTVHELLRYGYTGVLALVAINHWGGNSIPTSAEFQNLSAWGIAGALALAVPIGALVYLVSRTIIVTPISRFWESVFSVTPATEDERRTLSFLRGCGLSIKRCLHWIMDGIGLSHAQ